MSYANSSLQRVFLIDTWYQGKGLGLTWRLDQRVNKPGHQRDENRLYNQVQQHLNDLARTTGFDYSIRYWGTLEGVDQYIEDQGITLY